LGALVDGRRLRFGGRGESADCQRRALVMAPEVLPVDEPSIGLEPRFIDMVFEILDDLQNTEGTTIIMIEQNAKKGVEFADIGYVLLSDQVAIAGSGDELLQDPQVGRLFLGG
jgi:branched-chain amino acid transport system ATP-binding protein